MKTVSERVTIDVGGRAMGGYLAHPVTDGPRRFPAVLVFQEIFGVNAHIRSIVDRVAAEGYVALAPDYFHRTAPGIELGYDEEGMQKGMTLIPQLQAAEVIADANAAIAAFGHRDDVRADRIGAIGFCIGGHVAYLVASTGCLRATASFYGGGIATGGLGEKAATVDRSEGIKGKILLFFGGDDHFIDERQVDTIRQTLYKHSTRNEIFTYPNAGHGFFCDARGSYNKLAHDDAWRRVKKLFLDELHGG
ncbi:MAG: dienelactone hydrolase family protein [Myxococcales bacterium]|nr:dienelactone hydrolase family protein [Myxococcales bacterium]